MTFDGIPLYEWAWAVCMLAVGIVLANGIVSGKWGETMRRVVVIAALSAALIAVLYIVYGNPVLTIG